MIVNNGKRNFTHSHKDQISARCKHNSLLTHKGPRTPPLPEASDHHFCTPHSPLRQSSPGWHKSVFCCLFTDYSTARTFTCNLKSWFYYVVKVWVLCLCMQPSRPESEPSISHLWNLCGVQCLNMRVLHSKPAENMAEESSCSLPASKFCFNYQNGR